MGAFDDVAPITIPRSEDERREWGWEPHEQVVLKGRMSVADQKFTANKMSKLATEQGKIDLEMGTGRFALLERMIISWTFTHNGLPVPLNTFTIDQLPSTYSTPILSVIDGIVAGMSEGQQNDFLHSVNGPIVESSESANLRLMRS